MNNHQIFGLLTSNPHTKHLFKGVYSADNFPVKPADLPAALVINCDDSDEIGSHWIAVHLSEYELPEYFDSYGRQAYLPRLETLLGTEYVHNNIQLQSAFTTTCGQHVLYYILCKSRAKDMLTIINSYPGTALQNDIFVNAIVESAFDSNFKIIHSAFFFTQISRSLSKCK